MEKVKLSHLNTSFRVEGNEKKRSLDLKSITISDTPEEGSKLRLLVLDEKDITIYKQALDMLDKGDNVVMIGKRFVFYDHLTVRVEAENNVSKFSAEVGFVIG